MQRKESKRKIFHGHDNKLVSAFAGLLLLYIGITIGAMTKMPNEKASNNFFFENKDDQTTTASVAATTTAAAAAAKTQNTNNNAPPQLHQQNQNQNQNQMQNKQQTTQMNALLLANPSTKKLSLNDIHDLETLQHTFPIHAGVDDDDMEEINHPGIFFADQTKFEKIVKELTYHLPRRIQVPKFWRPKQIYGSQGVRHFLGEHGKRLMTPQEAKSIGSIDQNGRETIYVSVASYRDPECKPTVEDIYERAKYPERIRVAVIDQRIDGDSKCTEPTNSCVDDPEQPLCKYRHLIDHFEIQAQLSVGPVFARHLGHRLYRGEYFAMQVDSHVRFTEHWDEDLVGQWKSANNEMAVITTYLSDIIGSINPETHENQHPARPIMCKTDYESKGKLRHLRHGQQPEGIPGIHGTPTLHPFWAAGFSFARGHFVVQVPYDQYLPMVFQGEEISIGLRGFTYGYDYYTAERSVAFHIYAIKENKERRKKINLFWENTGLYPGANVAGMKRLNGIIGMSNDPDDEFYHAEEEEYGLGMVRPKEKFFKLYGIHTDTKTVEDHLCKFVGRPMQAKFIPYLRDNGMGIDFTKIDFEFVDPDKPPAEDNTNIQ